MQIWKDGDFDAQAITHETVAVIGYGNQARAQALNARDSGLNVLIGLREGSPSRQSAKNDGFQVYSIEEAVKKSTLIVLLIPDEYHGDVFDKLIAPFLPKGAALVFAHGFSVRFGLIKVPQGIDVVMVAPKGPGHTLRQLYKAGLGMPTLVGIEQDATGRAMDRALAFAGALGAGRAGILKSSFAEECETDLFSEQVVLCGGMPALIKAAFETLVDAGYAPEVAYIECLHEVKQIADLLWEGGLQHMDVSISNTAEFGGYRVGDMIVDDAMRKRMQEILQDIRSGHFSADFQADIKAGSPFLKEGRKKDTSHEIERAGKKVRALMPWLLNKK